MTRLKLLVAITCILFLQGLGVFVVFSGFRFEFVARLHVRLFEDTHCVWLLAYLSIIMYSFWT